MVQVTLVNPGKSGVGKEPLGLGFLASYLEEHGIDVNIVDEIAGANVEKELKKLRPDIVGVTGMTPFASDMYRIADFARENLNSTVVIGGVHATALPNEALKHADIVVVGEGELAMLETAQNLSDIRRGIISRPIIKDIDDIPMSARHLMDMDFYLSQKDKILGMELRTASIITGRGCPFRCIFCENSCRKLPVRFHSARRVIAEIKHLVEAYDIEGLAFVDECFTINKGRLREICQLMKENKLHRLVWECQTRVDQVDKKMLEIMKEAGCTQVAFGFESVSQRILDVLNKKTTVEQNKQAVRLCKEVGLRIRGCFMIGNPTETPEDIDATRRFIEENDIDYVGVFLTTPYPGTMLWYWCEEHGLIPKNLDWSKFTTYSEVTPFACDTIPAKEIKRLYADLIMECARRNYSFTHLIKRTLKNPKFALRILLARARAIS